MARAVLSLRARYHNRTMSNTEKRRFFLIVLDGCGAGEMPDALEYGEGDLGSNTMSNTAMAVGGLKMPHLAALGWGNITSMAGVDSHPAAPALWGRLAEASKGKDTVTGHWEMTGVQTDIPFPTYPNGFPPETPASVMRSSNSEPRIVQYARIRSACASKPKPLSACSFVEQRVYPIAFMVRYSEPGIGGERLRAHRRRPADGLIVRPRRLPPPAP